jgi:hypothetical protein
MDYFQNAIGIFQISISYLVFHSVGILLFYILTGSNNRIKNNFSLAFLNKKIKALNPQDFKYTNVLLFMGLLLLSLHYVRIGGIPILRDDVEDFRVTAKAGKGQLLMLGINTLFIFCVQFSINQIRINRYFSFKTIFTYLTVVLFIIASGYRSSAIIIFVIIFVFYQVQKKQYVGNLKLFLLIFSGLVFIGVTSVLRKGSSGGEFFQNAELLNYLVLSFSRSGAINIGLEEVLNVYKDSSDYLWGRSYWIDLSTIMPGSQPNFGLWLKDQLGMTFSGGSLLIGDSGVFYINFGLSGVILFSFINSISLSYLYYRFTTTAKLGLRNITNLTIVGLTLTGIGNLSGFIYLTLILLLLNNLLYIRPSKYAKNSLH